MLLLLPYHVRFLSLAHQLSSAQQRTIALAQQSAASCFAVLCRAVLCCVACFAVLIRSYMPVSFEVSYHVPALLHQICNITSLNHNKCNPQLSLTQLYIAQQRAVPCLSLRCGVVSCTVLLSFEHIAVAPGIIQVPGTGMYDTWCVLVFWFSSVDCSLSVPMPAPPPPAQATHVLSTRT